MGPTSRNTTFDHLPLYGEPALALPNVVVASFQVVDTRVS